MKTISASPFMNSFFSLLISLASLLGISSFLNLQEEAERQKQTVQRSFFSINPIVNFIKHFRFSFILVIFILLFLEEEDENEC